MRDSTKAAVIANVMKHRHDIWARGEAEAPSATDFVEMATRVLEIGLARDEVTMIAKEVEDSSETLHTYDDIALYLIRRVKEVGGPLG